MTDQALSALEKMTAKVYGETFALYDAQEFEAFLAPLHTRLKRNSIDLRIFEGKRCLDAGAGSGRGSILMARAGAREVIGVDLSEKNVATARRWALANGLANLTFQQGSLHELPFADQSFDIVWCNGVLHHSDDPNRGLQEISRVLKVGGYMWLYLYGSGGIYWALVDCIREALQNTDLSACMALLLAWNVPIGRIAEFIDDWYVPWLRRYTDHDVASNLRALGFETPTLLRYGTDYDTSYRVHLAGEGDLWGEGDLRYFCRKSEHHPVTAIQLPDFNRKGSHYTDSETVQQFEQQLRALIASVEHLGATYWKGDPLALKIGVFAALQTHLRDLMSQPGKFPHAAFQGFVTQLQARFAGA